MIRVSCIIATYGDVEWADLAYDRARASALDQGFHSVICHHREDWTLASVRNEAAGSAEEEILVFLDADDELRPGYLDAMEPWISSRLAVTFEPIIPGHQDPYAAALPDEIDLGPLPLLLVPAVEYVNVDGTRQPPRIPQQGFWPKLNECVIGTAIPRWLFEKVGGFRELPSLEDYDLFLRCFDAGAQLQYVPDAVYVAHMREGSRNSDQSTYHQIWAEHLKRAAS